MKSYKCPICGGDILLEHVINIERVYEITDDDFIRADNNDIFKENGEWVRLICSNDREHLLKPTPLSDVSYVDFMEWAEKVLKRYNKTI